MKKAILFLMVSLCVIACGDGGLKSKADKYMRKVVKESLNETAALRIDDIETVVNNDSLCLLKFTIKGNTPKDNTRWEFYIVGYNQEKNAIYHYKLININSSDESLENKINKWLNDKAIKSEYSAKGFTEEQQREDVAYQIANFDWIEGGETVQE